MGDIALEKVEKKKTKFEKVVVTSIAICIDLHGDHLTKLFGSHNPCYDG